MTKHTSCRRTRSVTITHPVEWRVTAVEAKGHRLNTRFLCAHCAQGEGAEPAAGYHLGVSPALLGSGKGTRRRGCDFYDSGAGALVIAAHVLQLRFYNPEVDLDDGAYDV